jgi:multiple sugar transport system permease protein
MSVDRAPRRRFYNFNHGALIGLGLSAPAGSLMVVLILAPVLIVAIAAATNWDLGEPAWKFVGLDNFREMAASPHIQAALRNTALYILMVVPTTVLLGLFLAILVESGRSFRAFYRAVHFLPYMTTLAALALVWEQLLHPTLGLVNRVLVTLGIPTVNWLRDPASALISLAAIGVWQNLGLAMVLYMAALKTIPQDLHDAAEIDGAERWVDRLRLVMLPLIAPVSAFVLIITSVRALEAFDTAQVLTRGGPGDATTLLLFEFYIESFEYLRVGYGAAISILFLILSLALTAIQARIVRSRGRT